MNKEIAKQIAKKLDALIKLRGELQTICNKLDDLYDENSDNRVLKSLSAVQACIDTLKEAEKELYYA
jgi:hypothetical protein